MSVKNRPIIIILAALLGAVASYLSWSERILQKAGISVEGSLCTVSSAFNCQAVSMSPYATLFGIPLAVMGLVFYLVTLIAGLYILKAKPGKLFIGGFAIATFGSVAFSIYLFYISKFILGVLCLYCILMYLSNILLAVVAYSLIKNNEPYESPLKILVSGLDSPWGVIKAISLNQPTGSRLYALLGVIVATSILFGFKTIEPLFIPSTANNSNSSTLYSNWKARPVETIALNFTGSVLENDYIKGDRSAPIQIIEFSDFECGACRNFHVIVERILKANPGKIHFTNKFFPLDQSCNIAIKQPMHEHACYASNFVRCAGEQNQQWQAFDKVFSEPILDSYKPSRDQLVSSLFTWAKEAGLDTTGMTECIDSNRQLKKIKEDIDIALALDIQHTPTFFVNGKRTNPDELEQIISMLVKQ